MKMTHIKKAIGTLTIAGVLFGAGFMAVPSEARADFINSLFGVTVDGILVAKPSNGLSVTTTSGTEPITIQVTPQTIFEGGPFEMGDQIRIIARFNDDNVLIANRVVKRNDGYGYGTEGDPVAVTGAEVIEKTADQLIVETSVTVVTFRVTPSTLFIGRSFENLELGDIVQVSGEDTGFEFVAEIVNFNGEGDEAASANSAQSTTN